jgi:transcriptional regulator with XRE-family HTH domain
MMDMTCTLGKFIKEKRDALGINQSELARVSGVLRETINRIENNKTMLPSADSRRRLARALNVRHIDLLVAAGELTEDEVDDVAPMVANNPDIDLIAESWEFLDRQDREAVKRVVRSFAESNPGYSVEEPVKVGHD